MAPSHGVLNGIKRRKCWEPALIPHFVTVSRLRHRDSVPTNCEPKAAIPSLTLFCWVSGHSRERSDTRRWGLWVIKAQSGASEWTGSEERWVEQTEGWKNQMERKGERGWVRRSLLGTLSCYRWIMYSLWETTLLKSYVYQFICCLFSHKRNLWVFMNAYIIILKEYSKVFPVVTSGVGTGARSRKRWSEGGVSFTLHFYRASSITPHINC